MLDVLRNCPNLFHDCHLDLQFLEKSHAAEYLEQLNRCMRPFCIRFRSYLTTDELLRILQTDELLQQPFFLNNSRLAFSEGWNSGVVESSAICQWLHHKLPSDETGGTTRVFYFTFCCTSVHVRRIVDQCKQLFEQAKTADDRRAFMLLFSLGSHPAEFELKNEHTGELLKLKLHSIDPPSYDGEEIRNYVLRRFLPNHNLANTDADDQFYRETLEQMGAFSGIPMKNGKKMPILEIQ